MSKRGEVLVAIMNSPADWAIVQEQGWYRIPIASARRFVGDRWPPTWLAFYQTKIFGSEAFAVRYYAPVKGIREVIRQELFPDEKPGPRSGRRYYQVHLYPLQQLRQPIFSRRYRQIVFIPTTYAKLMDAVEINDLFDESPLEDKLWAAMKRFEIDAQRQLWVEGKAQQYALDFALFCDKGKINVETDGDRWHADPERIPLDNLRDNELESLGWSVLRYSTPQIQEGIEEYVIPNVMSTVNRLGGISDAGLIPRRFDPTDPAGPRQLTLFDESPPYGEE